MIFNKSFLSAFDKILITGAQRSGTTIMSKFIHSLLEDEYELKDEKSFKTHNENEFMKLIKNEKKRYVIQCPAMAHIFHELWRKKVFVIWMHRNEIEVIRSQDRIGWTEKEEYFEKRKYFFAYDLQAQVDFSDPICMIKNKVWLNIQKHLIAPDHQLEVYYPDLAEIAPDHWIDQSARKDFKPKQTKYIDPEIILKAIHNDGKIDKEQFDYYYGKFVTFK